MKIKSTLPERPFFVHVAALLNLIIIMVMIALSSQKVDITRGLEIQLPLSPYILPASKNMATITVTGAEEPIYYLNDERYTNMTQLEKGLDIFRSNNELENNKERLFIILRVDSSVTSGQQMELFNLILSKGLACAIAASSMQ